MTYWEILLVGCVALYGLFWAVFRFGPYKTTKRNGWAPRAAVMAAGEARHGVLPARDRAVRVLIMGKPRQEPFDYELDDDWASQPALHLAEDLPPFVGDYLDDDHQPRHL